MIVTCPACQTRYFFDDAALGGAAGRRVRCASCGNLWHYSPEGEAIQAAVAEATAAVEAAAAASPSAAAAAPVAPSLRAEPGTRLQPPAGRTVLARPPVMVALPAAARRRSARVGGLGLIMLAAAVALVAILARDSIMAMWPSTTPVYATLHLTEPPGAGLAVTWTLTRTADSLIVAGDIVNSTAMPRRVAPLRVTLRDGNRSELDSKVIDPPVDRLMPGATVHFNTVLEHPSITATGVAVEFAAD